MRFFHIKLNNLNCINELQLTNCTATLKLAANIKTQNQTHVLSKVNSYLNPVQVNFFDRSKDNFVYVERVPDFSNNLDTD